VLGLLFGALTGLSRTAERLLDPTFQMLRTIPIMGLVPLFIVWFGLGELPKILLIAIAAFFLVYIQMYAGIRNIDRKLIEVGRMYDLSTVEMLRRIIVPAAMPSILQGVRLGLGVAWLALVIAELTGANVGIGHWMQQGREFVRVDIVLAALVVFAAVGKGVDSLVRLVERRLLSWRDNVEKEMDA
jgi:sulfonate transport system permease protein